MSLTDFLFTVLRTVIVSTAAGLLFWTLLRKFQGVSPNVHRFLWFGVLLLGLCMLRVPVDVPYDKTPNTVTRTVVPEPVQFPQVPAKYEIPKYERTVQTMPHESVLSAAEKTIPVEILPKKSISLATCFLVVWLTGVSVLFVRRIFLFTRLHIRLRSLQKAATSDWQQLLSQFGIAPKKIPILWTENSGPALVCSLFGYRLLFPQTLWNELPPKHRDGVLRHELSHYLNGDAFVTELARLLVMLQWFSPISWLALRKLEEATEWRCDDFAYFNREDGPKQLIETLLTVHESTESLGLYLSSFARINVIHRINRLLTPHQKENSTMKKMILSALFLVFLCGSLLKINLVAKQPTEVAETESIAVEEKQPQASDPEIDKLIQLAESMTTLPDITAERLRDVARDLSKKDDYLRETDQTETIRRTLVKVYDKIILLKPSDSLLEEAYRNKFYALRSIVSMRYADEDILALDQFADQIENVNIENVKWFRRDAKNWAKRSKIWQLNRDENASLEKFQDVRTEIMEYLKTNDEDIDSNIATDIVSCGERLHEKGILPFEQLEQTFELAISALESQQFADEYAQEIKTELEMKLAFLRVEGKTLEITGTNRNGKSFDWNSYKGKNVLLTFTSSWYGGREMQDVLQINEEFADKGLETVTYVALLGQTGRKDAGQDEEWLKLCVEKLKYPGVILTKIESPELALKGITDLMGVRQYTFSGHTFLLVGKDGKVISLTDAAKTRDNLVKLLGTPNQAATDRGNARAKEYISIPKPCESNSREIMLAMHNYHDVNKSMPPAYTMDEKGKKLHSWRTLLLPYLGYHEIYEKIRLDEPWNSEHNKQFSEMVLPVFQCHETAFGPNPQPITSYAVVVGPGAPFEENGKALNLADFFDGTSNTIVIVERATPVNWMEPTDITFDEAVQGVGVSKQGIANAHETGSNCAFCDGSTYFLKQEISSETIRALLTRSGGESVPRP